MHVKRGRTTDHMGAGSGSAAATNVDLLPSRPAPDLLPSEQNGTEQQLASVDGEDVAEDDKAPVGMGPSQFVEPCFGTAEEAAASRTLTDMSDGQERKDEPQEQSAVTSERAARRTPGWRRWCRHVPMLVTCVFGSFSTGLAGDLLTLPMAGFVLP